MTTTPAMADAEGLLTPIEAAGYLKVTVQTLAAWRWKRKGPDFRKVGRAVRYSRPELDRWSAR